jgi:CRP-like cAMP-binding protein
MSISISWKKGIFPIKKILKWLSELSLNDDDHLYWKFGKTLPPDTIIFKEGESGSKMYIIQSGLVSLSRKIGDRDIEIAILGPGEFLGEMSLLADMKRSATARTVEEVRIIEIDDTMFESLLRTQQDVALKMLKRFAYRINEANRYAERLIFLLWRERVILNLLILNIMGEENSISFNDIVKETGLNEHIVTEILNSLEASGYIYKEDGGMYRIINKDGLKKLIGKEKELSHLKAI